MGRFRIKFQGRGGKSKGQENRLAVAKAFVGAVFTAAEKQHISLSIDLKKPDFLLVVHSMERNILPD